MTSIARLVGRSVPLGEVVPHVIQAFVETFRYDHWVEKEELDALFIS